MIRRITQLVALGFAILISMGLATNLFLTVAVQHTLLEAQHIEDTAVEARAATRSLRADYLQRGGDIGAALLDPDMNSKFREYWRKKLKSDDNADKHLKKALQRAQSQNLRLLLGQLKAHNLGVSEPLERQLAFFARTDVVKAREFYLARYLPAARQNIKLSEAALSVATQDVLDLKEDSESRAAFALSVARRAILIFVILGVASGLFLTGVVATVVRKWERIARANQNMLQYSQDVICSTDELGHFIEVSPACQTVWGYAPGELKGRPFRELVHPDDLDKTNKTVQSIEAGIAVTDFENRVLCQDGTTVDMLWSAHWSLAEKSMFCVGRDITERKIAQEKLRTLAMFDGLTSLMNRSAIMGCLTRELERATREDQSVSILLLDLDHFKRVNDTYGHAAGDAVLQEAARRMKHTVRSYDEVGRYGGEEFLVVAPGCASENLLILAERVRQSICGTPFAAGGRMLDVSCSMGAAVTVPGQKEDIALLIDRADAALYRAKGCGRNRTELAPEAVTS